MGANKEMSPIACIRVGKGTPRTDRVPIAIHSGIYSKPRNRREQELCAPPGGLIQPCAHCVDYKSSGDTTNGCENCQPPGLHQKGGAQTPSGEDIATSHRCSRRWSPCGAVPSFRLLPSLLPLPVPSPGGFKSDLQKTREVIWKTPTTDTSRAKARGSSVSCLLCHISPAPSSISSLRVTMIFAAR